VVAHLLGLGGFKSCQGLGCLSLVNVVLSGRGLCISLITHPEECDHEASTVNWPWLIRGYYAIKNGNKAT